jgi:hypothetical protein
MPRSSAKERLIEDIKGLPDDKVKEVISYVSYLNLREDDWFIDLVNSRTALAKSDRKAGKKFTTLQELQRNYK